MRLLEVENLTVNFYTPEGVVRAVDGLSYQIDQGERFGVVGESGAGKSVSGLSLLRLIENPGQIERGSIRFFEADAIEEFESSFPSHVVDVDRLREEHALEDVATRLTEEGVSGAELTGNDRHEDVVPADLPHGAFDMSDVVNRGYAVELGLIDDDDFIVHDGHETYLELLRAPDEAIQQVRGNHIAMIFQDAQTALNPVYTIGEQIAEAIRHHLDYDDEAAKERTINLLDTVGIPDAEARYSDYPHEFSGGMQQRVVIAMALSCNPDLLVADEPTTALDVMTEAKVLEELDDLVEEFDTAIQLITHDLGVIAEVCDRVMVMYAGQTVETATAEDLYYDPKHPYTVGLMASIPRIGTGDERLQTIPGNMPDLIELPSGCTFHPRCPYAEEVCTKKEPPLVDPETGEPGDLEDERMARCLAYTGDLAQELAFTVTVDDAAETTRSGESYE